MNKIYPGYQLEENEMFVHHTWPVPKQREEKSITSRRQRSINMLILRFCAEVTHSARFQSLS